MLRSIRVLTVVFVVAVVSSACADSLWTESSGSLCSDTKARRVGDLVTIIIAESTASSQKTSSDYDKSFEHANAAGSGLILGLVPGLGYSSSQTGSAGGTTTMTNQLLTKLTATVCEVLPNGNLKLSATRSVLTNSEKQDITVTGTVRSQDVGPDNTVMSTYVAEVEIKYTGKGPAGSRQSEGLVSRMLKYLF